MVYYQLSPSPSLFDLYYGFHISQLKKFGHDIFQPMLIELMELKSDLTFQPRRIQLEDYNVKSLRNKEIS